MKTAVGKRKLVVEKMYCSVFLFRSLSLFVCVCECLLAFHSCSVVGLSIVLFGFVLFYSVLFVYVPLVCKVCFKNRTMPFTISYL